MKNTINLTYIIFLFFFCLFSFASYAQTAVTTHLEESNSQIRFTRDTDPVWSIGNIRGRFVFTQDSVIGTDDKVTILSDGKVGIGIGSPEALLHIDGVGSELLVGEGGGVLSKFTVNAEVGKEIARFRSDGVTKVFISSLGRVGIGTATPVTSLHIRGSDSKLLLGDSGGDLAKLTVNAETGTEIARFRSNGITKVFISETGRMGVGNASPSGLFEVSHNASIDDPTVELQEDGTDFARLRFRNASNTSRKFSIISNPGNTNDPELRITYEEGTTGGANTIFSIDGDDREVGINTTSPGAYLDVRGTSGSSQRIIRAVSSYTGSSDFVAVEGVAESGSGDGWGGNFSGNFIGCRGAADGGNGNGPVYGLFGFASGGANAYAVFASGDLKATSQLFVGTNATQEAAGSSFEVLVDGQGLFEEVKIKTSAAWPDFVFEKDYSLMTLDEVEQHIKENGHLPGVPSAQEIQEKEGFFIGDMHKLQLQKIEELTLYTIDLNKENKELKEELNDVKDQLKMLMERLEALEDKN